MTMADTVAVMNNGRIEQMGAPSELYEAPSTTFVANFLGQSNLVTGRRIAADGESVTVLCHGHTLHVPVGRCGTEDVDVLLGVRPEKIHLGGETQEVAAGLNTVAGGIVSDASFMGVSTQYLVRLPWGQDLTVFAQNRGIGEQYPVGSRVTLSWEPAHTFALAGDATAGVESDLAVPVG